MFHVEQKAKVLAPNTHYYLDYHLGTTQMELSGGGWPLWQGQFTPFGMELDNEQTAMHYKFTGKERDAETGLDFFGARYYSSGVGRWMSPDWAEKPEDVPYAKMDDPQSLNLYGYVGNNPLSKADADGHCPWCEQAFEEDVAPILEKAGGAIEEYGATVTHAIGAFFVAAAASANSGNLTGSQLSCIACAAAPPLQSSAAKPDAKAPPNPNGSKGAPDHQAGVKEEADKARAAAGPGETVTEGKKIQVAGSTRQPDVQTVGADGKTKSVVEVERRPGSARNKAREAEYNSLGVNHTTVPLPPKPQP